MDANQTDHPTTDARSNLSKLISATQLLRRGYFLTNRGKRQAVVHPVELGEVVEQVGGPDKATEILTAHLESNR